MKSKLERVTNLQRKLDIQVPASAVTGAFDKVYKGLQKSAQIKGFRQGKAPIATIKSVYGDRVQRDVVQELVQKHYVEALKEHNIEPISYPDFEFDVPNEGADFSFTANFEVRPEVSLKNFQGLEIEKEKFEVSDDKINQVLENIRAARAQLVDVLEDRPAQNGDVAIIDFEGLIDGKALENGSGQNHHLELGSNSFIDGFEAGIVGMRINGATTLNLKFPDPYHSADLAGKPVQFKITLKGLKKRSLPELTDAFVQDMMGKTGEPGAHTVESLKKTIRTDIEQSEAKRIEGDLKNRLLKKLVSLNPVEVPASMLHDQKAALVEDMKKRMSEQGMGDKDFESYVQKWDKDFENTAAEMIQSGFLIDQLAKDNNLQWNEEDLENKFVEYSKQTGLDVEKIKEFYSRPEQMGRITYMITEDKVIAFLLKSAKVKEVSKEQLTKAGN